MSQQTLKDGSLVLYKVRPAVITAMGEKITIMLEPNKAKRVRERDISLLHPGPLEDASRLQAESVDVEEAWELLDGETSSLAELADLLFGEYTPQTAWSTWQAVAEGVHFDGTPDAITARSREQVEQDLEELARKAAEEEARQRFFENIANASLTDEDRKRLSDVEQLALGTTDKSSILKQLDVKQTPESAHQFLLRCGYWPARFNPYPRRLNLALTQPDMQVMPLPDEERMDLTGLSAYAIDDEGSEDPDDAISFADGMLWVHVADVAALVPADSPVDLEARRRGANLYLPEGVIHMLPVTMTEQLGLGLQTVSPALSIGMPVDDQGNFSGPVQVVASLVKVQRLTYRQADEQLQTLLPGLEAVCNAFRQQRLDRHAAQIDLPEGSVRVIDDEIVIKPMEKLASRQLVTDAMLMAGVAMARFCQEQAIVIPYAFQPEPEEIQTPQSLSGMYAYRRQFKASRTGLEPAPHFGLGLAMYTRCTSPLRRYQDLVVHQQVRTHIRAGSSRDASLLQQQLSGLDTTTASIRKAERLSNFHWKLLFLQENPDWRGEAVVVEIDERKSTVVIPQLAMETKIRTREKFRLDDTIRLRVSGVELPEQLAYFQCL